MKAKFSIVMPVYNRASFLDKILQAYASQSLREWEMIIVDDCSTDGSYDIAVKFSELDDRIKPFRLSKNGGVGAARSFGNTKAQGEYIVVADSDDKPYVNRLESIEDGLKYAPDADVLYTNVDIYNTETNTTRSRFFQPFNRELLYYINYIPNPASCYRLDAYNKVGGYDPELLISEDYDLWLSFADAGMKFIYSPQSTVLMTQHGGSVRVQKQEEHKKFLDMVRKKHSCPAPDSEKVKALAELETYNFFSQPSHRDRWFT